MKLIVCVFVLSTTALLAAAEDACLPGTYSNTGNTPCTPLRTCTAGSRILNGFPGTRTADRRCVACGPAKFQDKSNAAACMPWSRCGAGTYVSSDPSTASDRECITCALGSFQPDDDLIAPLNQGGDNCTAWGPVCAPGTYQTEPLSAVADRDCAKCNYGYFQPKADKTECIKALEVCPQGAVQLAAPTRITDRVCHSTTPTTTPTSSATTTPTFSQTTSATTTQTTTITSSKTTTPTSSPTTTLTTTTTPTSSPTTTTTATSTATTTPTQSTTTTRTATTVTRTTTTTTTATFTTTTVSTTTTETSVTATSTTTSATITSVSSTTTVTATTVTTTSTTTTTATATTTSATSTSATITTSTASTTTTYTTTTVTSTTKTSTTHTTTTITQTTSSETSTTSTSTTVHIPVEVPNWWDAEEVHLAIGVCAAAIVLFLAVFMWCAYSRCGLSFCCGCYQCPAGCGIGTVSCSDRCPACCKDRSRRAILDRRDQEAKQRYFGAGAVNPQQMPYDDSGMPFGANLMASVHSMYNHDEQSMYSVGAANKINVGAAVNVSTTTSNPHYMHHFPTAGQGQGHGQHDHGQGQPISLEPSAHYVEAKIKTLSSAGDRGSGPSSLSSRTVKFADTVDDGGHTDLNTTAGVIADLKAAADKFDRSEHVWKNGAGARGSVRSLYDDFNPVDDENTEDNIMMNGNGVNGAANIQPMSSFGTAVDAVTLPLPSSRTVIVESGGAGVGIAVDACAKIVPGSSGVCIVSIAEGSAAAATGQIMVGDVITSVNNQDLTGATVAEAVKQITETNTANGCFVLGIATVASVVDAVLATPSTRDAATIKTYDAWNASFNGGDGISGGGDGRGASVVAGVGAAGWDGSGNVDTPDDARGGSRLSSPPPPPPPGAAPDLSGPVALPMPTMPAGPRPTEAPPDFVGTALKKRLKERRNEPAPNANNALDITQSIKQKLQQRREKAEGAGAGIVDAADDTAAGSRAIISMTQIGGVESSGGGSGGSSNSSSRLATARYDFEATDPDHLAVVEGDVLTLVEDRELWVLAENTRGEQGIVPANYVVESGTNEGSPVPPPIPASDGEEEQSWA